METEAISSNSDAVVPFRLPFNRSWSSTFTWTYIACGSVSSSTVTTHGPTAIGTPSADSTGDPSAECARQSLTRV